VRPETRYAKSGGVSIAYQVHGEGPIDLVYVPGFVSHVEVAWEEPNLAHLFSRLASFARLILFDKRGTGLSDPVTSAPGVEERMDDIRAVMDAAGSARAAIFGTSEGGTLSLLFAHRYPDRATSLILYGSWARRLVAPDYPWGLHPEKLDDFLDRMEEAWATGEWWNRTERDPSDDDAHRQWWARYLRMSASPAMARAVIRMNTQVDLRHLLPMVSVPTLILHRAGDNWIGVDHGRYLARGIRGAKYVELPGTDHRLWLGDVEPILAEVEIFLTGRRHRPRQRVSVGSGALSRREHEVALLASRGQTAAQIAKHLFISERTVETHLSSVYAKLGLRSKGELILRAPEFGI
jgi:pimeloyl-ACP methyl ester carboxylesterase/DNA-binding CsgD family transcriptional regulator